jgi:hypothetical protein
MIALATILCLLALVAAGVPIAFALGFSGSFLVFS